MILDTGSRLAMTTTLESTDIARPDQYVYLEDVSWDCYEMLVQAAGNRHLQITYDRGRMEIMSPLPGHERVKSLIGMMVAIIAMERQIDVDHLGSTTFRRRVLEKGLEPDECFYIQNHHKVWDKEDLDLETDPPPDLALEVEATRRIVARLPIYSALGVPEVWRHDGIRLHGLRLAAGKYEPIASSLAFPFLKLADLNLYLDRWPAIPQTALLREFREFVRQGM
jgi:Uma2 family endonuclease